MEQTPIIYCLLVTSSLVKNHCWIASLMTKNQYSHLIHYSICQLFHYHLICPSNKFHLTASLSTGMTCTVSPNIEATPPGARTITPDFHEGVVPSRIWTIPAIVMVPSRTRTALTTTVAAPHTRTMLEIWAMLSHWAPITTTTGSHATTHLQLPRTTLLLRHAKPDPSRHWMDCPMIVMTWNTDICKIQDLVQEGISKSNEAWNYAINWKAMVWKYLQNFDGCVIGVCLYQVDSNSTLLQRWQKNRNLKIEIILSHAPFRNDKLAIHISYIGSIVCQDIHTIAFGWWLRCQQGSHFLTMFNSDPSSNYIYHNVWGDKTYPFSTTVEVSEWISDSAPLFTGLVMPYSCWDCS